MSAIGATYAGALTITTTSSTGIALGEAIELAMITELPLVVINIQRGGPSTGLPTKTGSQTCFRRCMGGRMSDSHHCGIYTRTALMPRLGATRIAIRHTIPVMLLTDGYLANGSEPEDTGRG